MKNQLKMISYSDSNELREQDSDEEYKVNRKKVSIKQKRQDKE